MCFATIHLIYCLNFFLNTRNNNICELTQKHSTKLLVLQLKQEFYNENKQILLVVLGKLFCEPYTNHIEESQHDEVSLKISVYSNESFAEADPFVVIIHPLSHFKHLPSFKV